VNVLRDLILDKNPKAEVEVHAISVNFESRDFIAGLIQSADIVICGTDNRQSKLLINELCVAVSVTAIYGGAFRRAYGGQVLRVRPSNHPVINASWPCCPTKPLTSRFQRRVMRARSLTRTV
jgi:molybdopterin/thiamine biosynthesis adenylyltransferase